MKVNLYINSGKVYNNGRSPIYISVYVNGKRLVLPTGETCNVKHWLKSKEVSAKDDDAGEINERIKERFNFVNGLNVKGQPDPRGYIKEKFAEFIKRPDQLVVKPGPDKASTPKTSTLVDKTKSFLDLMEDWIEEMETDVQMTKGKKRASSTINTYDQAYKVLSDFEKNEAYPLTFEGMDKRFYNAFHEYVTVTEEKSLNTFGKYITKLKTFLNWALINHQVKVNPYYVNFHAHNKYVGVDFLTKEQLKKLYELNLDDHKEKLFKQFRGKRYTGDEYAEKTFERLQVVKDMFLFLCYTSLRYSDFIRLESKHIKGEMIEIPDSEKTDVALYIPFYDDLFVRPVEIVDKYRTDKGFIFPRISNPEFNRYLKHLNQFLDIDFELTTKVGRKTFVSYMMNERKLYPFQVMAATGHKKEESFLRYFGIDKKKLIESYKEKSEFVKKTG